jgi:anti-sigma regulatory factor (Ser/Thr protein kinase)
MAKPDQSKKTKFEVSFFSRYEEEVEAKYNDFISDLNLCKEDKRSLLTAIMELVLNAEEHSKTPDNKVFITFLYAENRILIRVEDKGVGLTSEADAKSPFRGNGLKLARALVDSLIVSDYEKGLMVTAMKELKRGNE